MFNFLLVKFLFCVPALRPRASLDRSMAISEIMLVGRGGAAASVRSVWVMLSCLTFFPALLVVQSHKRHFALYVVVVGTRAELFWLVAPPHRLLAHYHTPPDLVNRFVGYAQLVAAVAYSFCDSFSCSLFISQSDWHTISDVMSVTYVCLCFLHLAGLQRETSNQIARYAAFSLAWLFKVRSSHNYRFLAVHT